MGVTYGEYKECGIELRRKNHMKKHKKMPQEGMMDHTKNIAVLPDGSHLVGGLWWVRGVSISIFSIPFFGTWKRSLWAKAQLLYF